MSLTHNLYLKKIQSMSAELNDGSFESHSTAQRIVTLTYLPTAPTPE